MNINKIYEEMDNFFKNNDLQTDQKLVIHRIKHGEYSVHAISKYELSDAKAYKVSDKIMKSYLEDHVKKETKNDIIKQKINAYRSKNKMKRAINSILHKLNITKKSDLLVKTLEIEDKLIEEAYTNGKMLSDQERVLIQNLSKKVANFLIAKGPLKTPKSSWDDSFISRDMISFLKTIPEDSFKALSKTYKTPSSLISKLRSKDKSRSVSSFGIEKYRHIYGPTLPKDDEITLLFNLLSDGKTLPVKKLVFNTQPKTPIEEYQSDKDVPPKHNTNLEKNEDFIKFQKILIQNQLIETQDDSLSETQGQGLRMMRSVTEDNKKNKELELAKDLYIKNFKLNTHFKDEIKNLKIRLDEGFDLNLNDRKILAEYKKVLFDTIFDDEISDDLVLQLIFLNDDFFVE